MIHSDGSFSSWLANLGKKSTVAISLARDNLPGLVSSLTSNAINKFQRKISGKVDVIAGKGFTLFISSEEIIKIMKSLEDSNVLIDGVTETVKHEIKKTRRRIPWSFVSVISRFISAASNFFSSKRYKWKRS